MKDPNPQRPTYLNEYKPPAYTTPEVELEFDLAPKATVVTGSFKVEKNGSTASAPLELNGYGQKVLSVSIDGKTLEAGKDYEVTSETLTIPNVPDKFTLVVKNEINPEENKALEGLYLTQGMYCTQNEPEGFRRIIYSIDRSDNMGLFRTKIIAPKKDFPILLSNGNLKESGDLEDGKHFTVWEDPFRKPSYLFALVAGDLGHIKDSFTTMSGRTIDLLLYCDKGNEKKLYHAMDSLKKSMKWDEEVYGLEYDLDIYMIVAVDAFNMGAMENKGLNIFNTSCVMADPESANDNDYLRVEAVVAHEYFHNWTGNRVTCRDWFQLTLKEGLTVFRDQEFSSDVFDRPVQRIQDVDILRRVQFQEDSGPNSHPIRPDHYIEINNFYSSTVYNKGAEVIRMVHTLLGAEGFRKGMDKYFELYDGQAVTTEDFIHAMSVANDKDFTSFKKWYSQSGTPVLKITSEYDQGSGCLTLNYSQHTSPTSEQKEKGALDLPLKVGLLSKSSGAPLDLSQSGHTTTKEKGEILFVCDKDSGSFSVKGLTEEPLLSLNRDFSAPIKLEYEYSNEELSLLLSHDPNAFSRWEAGQVLYQREVLRGLDGEKHTSQALKDAFSSLLKSKDLSKAALAMTLKFPGIDLLLDLKPVIDFNSLHETRQRILKDLVLENKEALLNLYHANTSDGEFKFTPEEVGRRMLKNTCLRLLRYMDNQEIRDLASKQFLGAKNMTDSFAALLVLSELPGEERDHALKEFEEKWQDDPLTMNKWFQVQAMAEIPETFDNVKTLLKHPKFDIENPNKLRSLIGVFARYNLMEFHHASGRGYDLLAEIIEKMDKVNPSMASALSENFSLLKRLDAGRQAKMKVILNRLKDIPNLSKNTFEIISNTLK